MLGGCECSGTGCNELERRIDRVVTGEEGGNGNVGVVTDIWVCAFEDVLLKNHHSRPRELKAYRWVGHVEMMSRTYSSLNVSDNKIGDTGTAALVECLKEMKNIKELYLGGES